jgi:hypothetical protein
MTKTSFKRYGISASIGAVAFAGLLAMSWGLDATTVVPSLLVGALAGCAGGCIGWYAFRLKDELANSGPLVAGVRLYYTVAAVVSGMIGGAILSLLAYWSIWLPFVYHLHPGRVYPGYMEWIAVAFNGGLLTAALSAMWASMAVQSLLGTRGSLKRSIFGGNSQ